MPDPTPPPAPADRPARNRFVGDDDEADAWIDAMTAAKPAPAPTPAK